MAIVVGVAKFGITFPFTHFSELSESFAHGKHMILCLPCRLTYSLQQSLPDPPIWVTMILLGAFTLVVIPTTSLFCYHFLNVKLTSPRVSSRYEICLPISLHFFFFFFFAVGIQTFNSQHSVFLLIFFLLHPLLFT